jgi:hypothetical protein
VRFGVRSSKCGDKFEIINPKSQISIKRAISHFAFLNPHSKRVCQVPARGYGADPAVLLHGWVIHETLKRSAEFEVENASEKFEIQITKFETSRP